MVRRVHSGVRLDSRLRGNDGGGGVTQDTIYDSALNERYANRRATPDAAAYQPISATTPSFPRRRESKRCLKQTSTVSHDPYLQNCTCGEPTGVPQYH